MCLASHKQRRGRLCAAHSELAKVSVRHLTFHVRPACCCRSTEQGVLRIIASQYLAALILGFANSATVQPVIAVERPVMYRERAAGESCATPFGDAGFPPSCLL